MFAGFEGGVRVSAHLKRDLFSILMRSRIQNACNLKLDLSAEVHGIIRPHSVVVGRRLEGYSSFYAVRIVPFPS